MDYRILGSLEVCARGRALELGGVKQRALLAILLLHANEPVSVDTLIDGVRGERLPPTAHKTLQGYVSRLRKTLENGGDRADTTADGVLATRGRGYLLRVEEGELDLDRFRGLVEQGRDALAAGDPATAASVLRAGLGLWRGPPLADLGYEAFAQPAIAQLEELQLDALEERVEADLALGRDRELVGELRALVERHPLRERLRGQLMLALYRCGRQAEALEVYQEFRRALSEQLGLDPGPGLQRSSSPSSTGTPGSGTPSDKRAASRPAAGRPAPTRSNVGLRRPQLAVGAALLAALAIAGAVVALGGGAATPVRAIVGDSVGAISPSGDAISTDVPFGSSPSAMATGAGAVWVSNYNAGTVSRIDPATRALVQTIQSGSTPSGIAVGAGAVWVANDFADTVSRIDPAVDTVVQTIPVGNAPSGVAVGDGSVWVSNSSDGTLSRIAATTGAVIDTIALGGDPTGLAAGLGALWVSDSANGRVLRVDPLTGQVAQSISVGTGPSAITVGYGSVWVANSLDGTVSRIDPQTDHVTATIPVGNGPSAIVPGAGGVWVANEFGESVSRVDPATNTVARTVALAGRPRGLAIATGLVWVSAQDAGTGHRGGTLTVMSNGGFGSLDPASPNVQIPSGLTLSTTNDGLTAFRRVGGSDGTQLVPDLAVSLPAPIDGGTTYTFQLHRGIRYSNGQPVRPEDFLRTFERLFALEAGVNSPGYLYEDLEGGAVCVAHRTRCDLSRAIVTDDRANTITFHLVGPDPEFLDKLAGVAVVAVPATTPIRDLGTQPLPATGPYEIASDTGREVRFVRNPYFREWSHAAQPAGYPDQIVWRIGASPEAAVTAVEQGRADYTLDPPPADRLNEVQTRFASQLHINPSDLTVGWTLNTRVAPFNNLNVRRALNYAVDRAKIATVLGQDSRPTCQLLPPYIPGYRPSCPYTSGANAASASRAPDLAKAQTLIAASRTRGARITVWSQGAPPIITNGAADAISRYFVALLDRLGYRATLKTIALTNTSYQPWDSRLKIQDSLGFEFAAYPAASQFLGPPYTSCASFIPASPNNANVSELCDHQLDTTVRRAVAAETAGSPTATALWTQADRRVTNDAPAVELATPSTTDLVSHRVGDYQYNPQQESVLIDQLWVH